MRIIYLKLRYHTLPNSPLEWLTVLWKCYDWLNSFIQMFFYTIIIAHYNLWWISYGMKCGLQICLCLNTRVAVLIKYKSRNLSFFHNANLSVCMERFAVYEIWNANLSVSVHKGCRFMNEEITDGFCTLLVCLCLYWEGCSV